jgi:hypothetical protein
MSEQEPTETTEPTQSRGMANFCASDMLEPVRPPIMTIRTRRVAKSVTKKQWTILAPEPRAAAIAVLRDIERHSPLRCFPNVLTVDPSSWQSRMKIDGPQHKL